MNEQSRKNKTVHNANCCVYGCSSRKNNNRTLHFHAFPKKDASTVHVTNAFGVLEKIDRRKSWTKVLLMGKPVTNSMRVCSLHFQESDYLAKGAALISMNRPKLKTTAVPSRNLPKIQHTRKLQQANDFQQKQRKNKEVPTPPPHLVLLPECQPDDVVAIKSEPVEEPIEFVPTNSLQNSVEHLPEFPPSTSRTKDVPIQKKKSSGKIYCRLCLEPAVRNQMHHLMIMDLNYVGKSEVSKCNKIMQTKRITGMIRAVMPAFDFDLAYNPIICHICVARLELAYKFITGCEENEKVIKQYKEKFSPNELVSCDDVAENKSLFVKPTANPRKKRKTSGNDSVESRRGTRPPVPRNVDQTEQLPDVGSVGRESQENSTPDTNLDASGLVKCEIQEEEYNDEGSSSRFVITSEELSSIVKEEIVVKEDVPFEFCDTSANERLGHSETDLTIKEEYGLPITCGTNETDGHHTDHSGNLPNDKEIRTYHSVGKKRKEMEDTTTT